MGSRSLSIHRSIKSLFISLLSFFFSPIRLYLSFPFIYSSSFLFLFLLNLPPLPPSPFFSLIFVSRNFWTITRSTRVQTDGSSANGTIGRKFGRKYSIRTNNIIITRNKTRVRRKKEGTVVFIFESFHRHSTVATVQHED